VYTIVAGTPPLLFLRASCSRLSLRNVTAELTGSVRTNRVRLVAVLFSMNLVLRGTSQHAPGAILVLRKSAFFTKPSPSQSWSVFVFRIRRVGVVILGPKADYLGVILPRPSLYGRKLSFLVTRYG